MANTTSAYANSITSVSGRVTDKQTGEPLQGAIVSISNLKLGSTTNSEGEYTLINVPKAKLLIAVSRLGYKTISQLVDFSKTSKADFQLEISVIEADEVVVTGSPILGKNSKNSTTIETISKSELTQSGATNIIDALKTVPGVSQITTGGAISKPVIRGLGYNRIVTLSNDVKQEGQQWGDEHGIEIDQYSASKVEVLRGPASLFYGSDALGGVINIIDPVVSAPGEHNGQLTSNYSTNNGLTASNLQFQGNTDGFVYRLNGTYKNAMSFKTPTERVYNSAFNESDLSAMLGFNKSWGFAHLTYTLFNTKIGLTEGERNENGSFVDIDGNPVSESDLKSRSMFLPFQHVTHQKLTFNSNVTLGSGFLKTTIGFQNNQRRELEETATDPATYFYLNTYSLDTKYYFEEYDGWAPVLGLSGTVQNNSNKGEEALIPAYDMFTGGAFAYVKKAWDKVTLDAGLRFDARKINGKQEYQFNSFNSSFSNLSGSIGLTWQLTEKLGFKANVGRGFRAPNIAELSADGIHEGTFRYEKGEPNLKQETSLQFDAALNWEDKYLSVELNGYYNFINDYIYYQNINNEQIDIDGQLFPVYHYIQGNSSLRGFEFRFDIHPVDQLHFENSFAYTRGTNNNTNTNLPFIPQAKLINSIRYNFNGKKNAKVSNVFISLGLETSFKQDKVDPFETTSNGYSVLNATTGTTIRSASGKELFSMYLAGVNLGNTNYIDHLSRFKEIGILGMGRNITLGFSIPFSNQK
ncbi:TonB-dependent receptor [Solitalea longa]|uniref:TonB-dependent receptor n=2 Tax=Solitalea longa TaxID=2079460 RepID=A0A2S5A4J3_9SPHI|nr:TonB-dependent receptor [Solitalea longa]